MHKINILNVGTRVASGNTPIRGRNPGTVSPIKTNRAPVNKENTHDYMRTLSPNKLNATRKPAVTVKADNPVLTGFFSTQQKPVQPQQKVCSNHPNRQQQFRCVVDGEEVGGYCGKCAAQLASQGFQLQKVQSSVNQYISNNPFAKKEQGTPFQNNNMTNNYYTVGAKKTSAPAIFMNQNNNNNYNGNNKTVREIHGFLDKIKGIDRQLKDHNRSFAQLENHYASQIHITNQFYNALQEHIEVLRNQQINAIKVESRKTLQLAILQAETNNENISEIQCIVDDVESNLEVIVNLSEEQIRDCLDHYNRQAEVYRHRAEQQTNIFQTIANLDVNVLGQKVELFRKRCNQFIEGNSADTSGMQRFNYGKEEQPTKSNAFAQQPTGVTLDQFFKKKKDEQPTSKVQEEGTVPSRSACRNLFEETDSNYTLGKDETDELPHESPSFKPL